MPLKCPKCQKENPDTQQYCGNCGTQLSLPGKTSSSMTKTLETPIKRLEPASFFAERYEILEELGKGGMGEVYKVKDKRLNEEMALKILKPEIAADKGMIERFKNELKLARKIAHRNVCKMYDLHEFEKIPYITMEYVRGENLKSMIQAKEKLPIQEAIDIAQQVCKGLAEAHDLGIIHRDLKPQNIMIDEKNRAKIMDFGISRSREAPGITQTGMIIGTPDYMSPEQAEAQEVDQRSDLYSFGVILFEMTTGRLPFVGETALSVILKHKTEIPPSPSEIAKEIPADLNRIILKCLEKVPEKRFHSVRELFSGLTTLGQKDSLPERQEISSKSIGAVNSIAVLPFKDMSPQHDQDYFCEGLAEELINALTQIKGLSVAARTSSFSFKGKEEDIREIGKQLNVESILEGSVMKSGDRLRIIAQLISVSDGYHLWSERFERNVEDIFAVQDEIAMAVVDKLKVELLEGEQEKLTKRHTQNKEAYELYLKGRYHWNRRSPKDMILAVECFQRAIDKDPSYALPYAGIADVFNMLAEFGFIPPQQAYLKSKTLLQKALEIDDSISEIYSSLALITYCYEWDLPAAERLALRAIELNPQNMFAHATYGEILGTWGRNLEALEEAKMGVEADPLSSMAQAFYGIIQIAMGHTEEGRGQLLRALAMEPDQTMFQLWLGMIYLTKPALPEKAIEYLQKAARAGVTLAYGYLGMAHAQVGQKEEALKCLAKLEKIDKERFVPFPLKLMLYLKPGLRHFRWIKNKYSPAFLKATIYCGLNRQEEALAQLEKSSRARDYLLPVFLRSNAELIDLPCMKELRSSPRFQALKEKIKV
jgi:serine/threonine protein kinase/tetratricopeptide (TPR) repeat protein